MDKIAVQYAVQIVTANVEGKGLSTENLTEMINSLAKTFDQLITKGEVQPEVVKATAQAKPKKPLSWEKSIGRTKVSCLICDYEGKTLGGHLKKQHQLSAKEYRKQFHIPARVSLTAKNLSAKRSKAAKERGAGEALMKAREAKKAKASKSWEEGHQR